MKKIIIGVLALTINSVQASGIYRYHDEDAYKAYRAQETYQQAKRQYKLMQKRAREYKKLARYHRKATHYSRSYEAQDQRTFRAEADAWNEGITIHPMYRPGLDFKQTQIKRVNY